MEQPTVNVHRSGLEINPWKEALEGTIKEQDRINGELLRANKELNSENKLIKSKLVSVFTEERVPQFHQGEPNHELLEVITADYCAGLVNIIEDRNREIAFLMEGLEKLSKLGNGDNVGNRIDNRIALEYLNHVSSTWLEDHDHEVLSRVTKGIQWLPMDKAPKDGTELLAIGRNFGESGRGEHSCIVVWDIGWRDSDQVSWGYLYKFVPLKDITG